tara:strand:+ start:15057 stop:15737 length:681 start_codon:yes stop_codon:yes gene_type:complete
MSKKSIGKRKTAKKTSGKKKSGGGKNDKQTRKTDKAPSRSRRNDNSSRSSSNVNSSRSSSNVNSSRSRSNVNSSRSRSNVNSSRYIPPTLPYYNDAHVSRNTDDKRINRIQNPYNQPVNKKLLKGNTQLHYAVQNNNIDVVRIILNDPNVKVNITNDKGKTPIGYATNPDIQSLLMGKVIFEDDYNGTQADRDGYWVRDAYRKRYLDIMSYRQLNQDTVHDVKSFL